jgi:hypothetical protein
VSNDELIDWIAFLELEEEQVQTRMVEALSIALMRVFGKGETDG